jgi:archaellum biogenesis ATPase FlaH
VAYDLYLSFLTKYNKLPSASALDIEYQQKPDFERPNAPDVLELINQSKVCEKVEYDWLLDTTEKWCKERALHLAIMESVDIIDGDNKEKAPGAIPNMLQDALSVSFDTNVGHDYISNAKERYEFYHRKEERIEFDLQKFNEITDGGVPRKTANVILGGTNVGKTLIMCHLSSAYLQMGYNVLYITMEMAEEKIAERIDANLFDVEINDLKFLTKEKFESNVKRISGKTEGQLMIKEYPTACAHVGHFRALLNELKLKKEFLPDVICVDYLGICASERSKNSSDSYGYLKMISEELRGMAVEYKVALWTGVQLNRSGFSSTDADLTNIAESWGIAHTADFAFMAIQDEQLAKANQYMIKQLKSRYGDKDKIPKFIVGVEKAKMRLYDTENSASDGLSSNNSTNSNSSVDALTKTKKDSNDYSNFKY